MQPQVDGQSDRDTDNDAEAVPGQGQGGRPETANNLVVAKKPEKTAQGVKEKGRSDPRKTHSKTIAVREVSKGEDPGTPFQEIGEAVGTHPHTYHLQSRQDKSLITS